MRENTRKILFRTLGDEEAAIQYSWFKWSTNIVIHLNFAEDNNLITLNGNADLAEENDETCVLLRLTNTNDQMLLIMTIF